jgi:hypothetical protein
VLAPPAPDPSLDEDVRRPPAPASPTADEPPAVVDAPLIAAVAPSPSSPREPPAPVEVTGPEAAPRGSPASPRKILSLRPRRALGPAIETDLGGLFYLVNLALYLGLYGDDENLALPLWDFVTLVGRALLGARLHEDDAVWPLLAELAGRGPDDPPGAGFVPPDEWRLPERWLEPFDPAPTRERLADAMPAAEPLERWLGELVPHVRARLRRALDVDDADLPAVLLEHRAHVHVTDANVDIVLSLETLPVAIRIAGLDRDPGWVAAAGRTIAFHFE